ncbi:MAG TPA: 5-guanidino-2-oxopentanoate decarboxylase [Stellaceae bacterium]|nr:5-guanidino-2-oxopentanoate decarboxylase [Stellaceae bacterium]
MTSGKLGGHAVVAQLQAYGVDTVFGIPGVHTLELYRGLAECGIRHIGVRHEQGAGFMADGYARASGKPGVCCLITGPGLMNAATAIGQAYSDSMPMLVLASVNATGELGKGRGRLHEITDQRAAVAPLTGFARTIRREDELAQAVADAYALFETGRPRPVVLEFPLDFLSAPAVMTAQKRQTWARPAASAGDLEQAASLIDGAERPVLLLGGGAVACAAEARAFAEKAGCLVVTTTAGKGVFPDSHPASLGATLSKPATQALLAESDLLVAVGTELSETDSWSDWLTLPRTLIRIDLDRHTLTRDYPPTVGLLADAGPTLAALTERFGRARDTQAERAARIRVLGHGNPDPLGRKHMAVLDAIRSALPGNGMLFSDMTQIAYTGNHYFRCEAPRSWFHPNGFGTLGYAMPAAIGAKLACPERPVAALAGDGGFLFTVQELGTAVEQRLALPIILWNNDALGQIAGDMAAHGIPALGVKPRNPDFQALARAFGANAIRTESLGALSQAIARAASADGPTLIEVREDAPYL